MHFQDVAAGFRDVGSGARVFAEVGDELGSILCRLLVSWRRDERPIHCGTHGDQRAPRLPQVQRGNVPLAYGFLPPHLRRDGFDGDIVFDQTLVGHALSLTLTIAPEMGI